MGQIKRSLRQRIFNRDKWRCFYCGSSVLVGPRDGQQTTITADEMRTWVCVDHLTPERLGGSNSPENLVTACRLCNAKKGSLTLEEYRERVARSTNGYGPAINHLQSALLATSTPYDAHLCSAIEWMESQIPKSYSQGRERAWRRHEVTRAPVLPG